MGCVSTITSKITGLFMAEKKRPWSDLPFELLSQISDRLHLIDLLRFRAVCKQWKVASSTSTAESESSPGRQPWFLMYADGSQCRLISEAAKNFTVDVPELDGGATCLASSHGWLLVLQNHGAIFFFCPFSRARIDLPRLDGPELSDLDVAVFSAPPSSRDCAVAVARRKSPSVLGLTLIRRGEEKWTVLEFYASLSTTVSCGAYRGGSFYFFDSKDGLAIFSLESQELKTYRVVPPRSPNDTKNASTTEKIPFSCHRDQLNDKKWAAIPDDVSISTCGTFVKSNDNDFVIFNESLGEQSDGRRLKGVWIHPRFFQISKDEISW
ncbi:F-box/kelch-repeat protein [Morus notabilis]|uniref:F-box/kelch-repeat protein n=1 Tax=Morus notabilis TaxID=981085 RepID=W9SBN8_9ROSA|nr:F-box/kelch-repeat protein At1g57790 [Morus notabilis]EXC34677.1 F-box/kelch-repeat protein [Morus notabilis]